MKDIKWNDWSDDELLAIKNLDYKSLPDNRLIDLRDAGLDESDEAEI